MGKTNLNKNCMQVKIDRAMIVNTCFCFYVTGIILVYVLPCLKYTIPYEPAALLLLLSFPFLFFSGGQQRFLFLLLICSILFGVLYFTVKIPGDLKESMNEVVRNLRFYLPASLGFYAASHLKHRSRTLLLYGFLLLVFFIMVVTIAALFNNPMLARALAEGVTISENTAAYRLANVGGYEFSYMIGVLTIVFVFYFMHPDSNAGKWLSCIAAAICFFYILESQYTILLILTTVFSTILLFWRRSHFFLKVIFILGLVLLFLNLDSFFTYLSQNMKQQMLADKFSWLAEYCSGNSNQEVLHSRPELYLDALRDFCKNPVWGSATESSERAHSYLLGVLSSGGLLGLSCYLTVFLEAKKHIVNCLISLKKDSTLFQYACLYCFLLSIINPIGTSFEIAIVLYFIIPVWISNTTNLTKGNHGGEITLLEMGRKT